MNTDPAADVLAGILNPDPATGLDRLLYALSRLDDDFFSGMHKALFRAVSRYYDVAGGVMGPKYLSDLLKQQQQSGDPAQLMLFAQTFADLSKTPVTDHEFRFAVQALRDRHAEQMTGEAITVAFEILQRGAEIETPNGREQVRGHTPAREYAQAAFADIERGFTMEHAPEGDIRSEADDVLARYAQVSAGEQQGVKTGIASVDAEHTGYLPGELGLIAAFTSAGKSAVCCQIAWHAATQQGRNVFFATSETVREAIRHRIIARHSRLPQFKPKDHVGEWRGLNSENLRRGDLLPSQFEVLKLVLADLASSEYGRIYIAQVPRGATLSYVENRMSRVQAQWTAQGEEGVGLAVVDYLGLLKSDRRRTSEREEMNEIIKEAKTFAVGFDNGNGVPLLSPWQMSREAHNNAQTTGHYTLGSLSDTSEAEKSADTVASLFREPGSVDTLTWQFLKMRNGRIPEALTIKTDYRNAFFTSPQSIDVSSASVSGGKATVSLGKSLGFDAGAFGI